MSSTSLFCLAEFDRYHEPFFGGGALFFYLAPQLRRQGKRAFLSDLNPELVNVYQCVRDQVEALIEQLAVYQRGHSEQQYYAVRSQLPTDPIQRAARFIYLNKTCYNGLYRENAKGLFNVPMGRYKAPKICAPDLAAGGFCRTADSGYFRASFYRCFRPCQRSPRLCLLRSALPSAQ